MESHQQPMQSYLAGRMQALGITDADNTFTRTYTLKVDDENGTKESPQADKHKIFTADDKDNIVINYFNQHGQPYRWKPEEAKWPVDYYRTRLKNPVEGRKYHQRKGSPQYPFFTPSVIAAYKKCHESINIDGTPAAQIETLIIVEGEFKAFKGHLCGLYCIGIPSIHGFYNGDVRGKLHEDIEDVIVTCGVKSIIYLVDADFISLRWEEKKDLAKRPESFFAAIKLFRESLQLLLDNPKVALQSVCFSHIAGKYMNEAKGLDDLLCTYSSVVEDIKKDLLSFQFARTYFVGKLINDSHKDLQAVRKYMGLSDVQEFYKCYRDFIGSREFLFKGKRYEYNDEKKEVLFVRHEDADKYMRIGADWFKVIKKIDKTGMEYEELKVWPIGEIQRDYKMGKNADAFIEQLVRYDDFINEPSWNGTYQRSVRNCYNLCYPFRWDKKQGEFPATEKFLKHVFGGLATTADNIIGDPFTIALDWLTIFHRDPKQALPVIVLVSKENETGKSTFMKWLRTVYGPNNAVILSNEEFKMKFNAHYISKALIMVDEGFLDAEKKSEKERLKKLVTSDTAYIEFKGADLKLINYYAKIVISSNDDDRVMKIEEEENRWFVIKVPPVAEKDPDLEKKMEAEIPAFIHFIANRQIHHPRKSRLWFQSELIITDQFKKIVEATKNRLDRVFEDWIREQFRMYRLGTIKYSLTYLTNVLNDHHNNKYKVDKIELRTYLHRKGVESEKHSQRFRSPQGLDMPEGDPHPRSVIMREMDPTFPYIFQMEKWLSKEECESLMPLTDPVTFRMQPPGKTQNNDDTMPF